MVQEAIAYVLNERRRMLDALVAMGYADAREVEPRGYRDFLRMFAAGSISTIGSEDDPFVLETSTGRTIARYYIKAVQTRCVVMLTGSLEFKRTLDVIAQRDACTALH